MSVAATAGSPPSISTPRRSGQVVFWLASGTFAIGAGEFAAMSLLPYFAPDLGVSEERAGFAITCYALGVVVGAPLISIFAARLPRKKVLLALMGALALGHLLTSTATSMTMLEIGRFIAGLPHGAYFGMAMLMAASLGRPEHRARAVSNVALGLAIATVVGVPLITLIGQYLGWRWGFVLVGSLSALTMVMLWRVAPSPPADDAAHPTAELKAMRNPRVLVTLGVGAVGFGGMFAVYSYFSAAFLGTNAGPHWAISAILVLYGVGTTLGNIVAGRVAAGRLLPTAAVFQVIMGSAAALYALVMGHGVGMAIALFTIGFGGGLVVPIQTRLMEVAEDAQTLAAAMNHVAFNVGNALGPWLAGITLGAGLGWASTGWVGVVLAIGGLAMMALGGVVDRVHARNHPSETTPAQVAEDQLQPVL